MYLQDRQQLASQWFHHLRDLICAEFEKIEEEYFHASNKPIALEYQALPKFTRKNWQRQEGEKDGGGGEISLMQGNVFEKVGVNFSKVYGQFSEEFRQQIPGASDGKFWASGISLVAHMRSPLVAAVHMNTRFISTQDSWFGGGADLNPIFANQQDTNDFHQAFKQACDKANPLYYPEFKNWCDKYFFIKHRNISRGVGGIFYDYLNSEKAIKTKSEHDLSFYDEIAKKDGKKGFAADFDLTKNVGLAFLNIFPKLVRQNMLKSWSEEQRQQQLIKRGYYTEFNLIYDRGTKFGLMTGGNTEAILMSLPPVARWE